MASPQYLTHRPLNAWQKTLLAVTAGVVSAINPHRADLVAASNETLGEPAFRRIHSALLNLPRGRLLLQHKPLVTSQTLIRCRGMDAGSFGGAYAAFMDGKGLLPEERPPVRFVNDAEVAYVATRYRQVHDFWHVLTGCPTNMAGELAVKTVEGIQTGLPNAVVAAFLSPVMVKASDRQWFLTQLFPWAIKTGFNATDLMSIHYENHFEERLDDLRRRWSITKAPGSKAA